jgi:hypothetical protein
MKSYRWRNSLYYLVKPHIPRPLQIAVRRWLSRRKLRGVANVWPINPESGSAPPGWHSWPSQRRFALVLTHDLEHERGVLRCSDLARMELEMGFVSSFNFVPERYGSWPAVRHEIESMGCEVGIHDLRHDGRLFESESSFMEGARHINRYLREWQAVGFRSGSMHHNLEWIHMLDIEYDASTFDTDPFEPQPDGMNTIFPVWIPKTRGQGGYVELPYTLPQDMTVFVIFGHTDTHVWKEKVAWIASRGGMALVNAHPDYMHFGSGRCAADEYPAELYTRFLEYLREEYSGQYWNAAPRDVARYWKSCMVEPALAGTKAHL